MLDFEIKLNDANIKKTQIPSSDDHPHITVSVTDNDMVYDNVPFKDYLKNPGQSIFRLNPDALNLSGYCASFQYAYDLEYQTHTEINSHLDIDAQLMTIVLITDKNPKTFLERRNYIEGYISTLSDISLISRVITSGLSDKYKLTYTISTGVTGEST